MAHQSAALIMSVFLSLFAGWTAAAQDGAVQKDDPATANEFSAETIFPPLPPQAAALALQCKVPQSEVAKPSPLVNTAARIEAGKKVRVLAIGSSATWASGRAGGRNYPSRLEKLLESVWKGIDVEIVNRGVSGEIASVSAKRVINEAAILRPSLVLWQLGTNDAVARVPVADFEHTVLSTVRMLQKNHIDVVIVGLQYTPKYARDEHWFAIRAALDRIAAEENLLYVRRDQAMEFLAQTKASADVSPDDEFSLTDLGFPCMAEHIAQAMVANIFLRRNNDRRAPPPATR